MITKIFATDRQGDTFEYDVRQEMINECNYSGIRYIISRPEIAQWKYFEVQTLNISLKRIMIFMLLNHDHPELKEKGIAKAMIKALSAEFKIDIVSSTNKKELKICNSEGRIADMTKAWKKWMQEFHNIEYVASEDRFVFHFIPQT